MTLTILNVGWKKYFPMNWCDKNEVKTSEFNADMILNNMMETSMSVMSVINVLYLIGMLLVITTVHQIRAHTIFRYQTSYFLSRVSHFSTLVNKSWIYEDLRKDIFAQT